MEIHPYRRQPFSEVGRGKFFKSFRKSLPPLRGNNTSDTPVTRLAVGSVKARVPDKISRAWTKNSESTLWISEEAKQYSLRSGGVLNSEFIRLDLQIMDTFW